MTEVPTTGSPGDPGDVVIDVTAPGQDGLRYLSTVDDVVPVVRRRHRVTGPLDLDVLRDAWHVLVERHDALRTTLPAPGGVPVRRISDTVTDPHVVSGVGVPDRLVREAASVRLDEGPLVRLTVVRQGPAVNVLVLTAHPAVADDESMSILETELSACYAALATGRRPALPPPTGRYADFARAWRTAADGPSRRAALDWWTATLTPPPPPLDLPADRPRRKGPVEDGGVLEFRWDGAGAAAEALAGAEGTTVDDVLLAAYQVLLHRLSGADRLSVGTPVSRRGPREAGLVGAFTNLVVCGADFTGAPTFAEHLRRSATTADAARDHADVPFDRVVRASRVERDSLRVPLADALLVSAAPSELHLTGAEVTAIAADTAVVTADLTWTVRRTGDAVEGSLAYRASLFDAASARKLLDQLHTLLTAALDRPACPVADLPLEAAAELRAATRAADLTAAGGDGTTVAARVHAVAEAHPDAPAVVWDGTTTSYGLLVRQAAAVTAALRQHGPVDGAAVAVRLPQGPRQIAALLGVLDAGAHLVCLGTGDTGERGRAVLADLRPVCLLTHGAATDDLAGWFHDELGGRVIDAADLGEAETDSQAARSDALAYVAYTSGSTGRPKGIPTTHASIAQFVGWFAEEFRVGPGSRVAQWAATGYDASLIEVFATLTSGATLYPVPDRIRPNPEKIVDWLAAARITLFQTVPTFAREVLKAVVAADAAESLHATDHVLLAGEALPGEFANALRAALPSVRLVNLYGPTETILATWHEVGAEVAGMTPIGRSIPGRQVLVLDDHDRPCPTGVAGHLVIVSPHVTPGYTGAAAGERAAFESPRADDQGIAPGRSYRTGDFGRRRWDGALEFLGRRDLQVKFQGVRVELTDIETALADHESVAECAVTAVTNADGLVTRLVAHIVPARDENGGALGSAKDWRAVLQARFGRSKYSLSFHTMLGLPRNLGGKVDRRMLPVPAVATPTSALSDVDEGVAAIWSELLCVEQAGTDETFFAAGGHSLLVPVLLDRIRERTGVEVPPREFLADPTITGLSARVGSPTTAQAAAVSDTRIG